MGTPSGAPRAETNARRSASGPAASHGERNGAGTCARPGAFSRAFSRAGPRAAPGVVVARFFSFARPMRALLAPRRGRRRRRARGLLLRQGRPHARQPVLHDEADAVPGLELEAGGERLVRQVEAPAPPEDPGLECVVVGAAADLLHEPVDERVRARVILAP